MKDNKISTNQKVVSEKKLEDLFSELEIVMKRLENTDISLEESFQLYQQGMGMLKLCNDKIDSVEKKVLILDEHGESYEF